MADFVFETPIGILFAEVTAEGIRRLEFASNEHNLISHRVSVPPISSEEAPAGEKAVAAELGEQLSQYFDGSRPDFDLPLDIDCGTTFQRAVWQAIANIPHGQTASYAEVAMRAGYPNAFRAVGSACGLNPVVLVVPCHRVVASGSKLGGFGGGLPTKVWLLRHEGFDCAAVREDATIRRRTGALLGI